MAFFVCLFVCLFCFICPFQHLFAFVKPAFLNNKPMITNVSASGRLLISRDFRISSETNDASYEDRTSDLYVGIRRNIWADRDFIPSKSEIKEVWLSVRLFCFSAFVLIFPCFLLFRRFNLLVSMTINTWSLIMVISNRNYSAFSGNSVIKTYWSRPRCSEWVKASLG